MEGRSLSVRHEEQETLGVLENVLGQLHRDSRTVVEAARGESGAGMNDCGLLYGPSRSIEMSEACTM
jgi:hypothetical protein